MATAREDDEADFDPEGPDPDEMDSSDDPDLDVCPHCRKMIVEDAERCPHCGQYIVPSDAPTSTTFWVVAAAVVAIVAVVLAWTR